MDQMLENPGTSHYQRSSIMNDNEYLTLPSRTGPKDYPKCRSNLNGKKKRKTRRKRRTTFTDDVKEQFPQGVESGFTDKEHNIDMNKVLNVHVPGWEWPDTHILHSIDHNSKGINLLLNDIMNTRVHKKTQFFIRMAEEYGDSTELQKVLGAFIKRHRSWKLFSRLAFEKYNLFGSENCESPVSRKVVSDILRRVIKRIVPHQLLGSDRNQTVFFKNIRKLAYGVKDQNFSLSSMVHGIKVADVPWLYAYRHNALRLHLLACTLSWLYSWTQTLMAILWIVMVGVDSKELFYYRKDCQRVFQDEIHKLVDCQFNLVEPGTQNFRKIMHFGTLKLLRKPTGVRPVMKFPTIAATNKYSDVSLCTRTILWQIADAMGVRHTMFGKPIRKIVEEGLLQLKSKRSLSFSEQPYYFVKVDIENAFGSIERLKLLKILDSTLSRAIPQDHMVEIVHYKKPAKICNGKPVFQRLLLARTPFMTHTPSEKWTFVKQTKMSFLPILNRINEAISQLGVKIGKKYYRMTRGIPQGMNLSCALCEIYLAALDGKYFRYYMDKPDELFIRFMDDYLYITPHKDRAVSFAKVMEASDFGNFGVHIRPSKTATNIDDLSKNVVTFVGNDIDIRNFSVSANVDQLEGRNITHLMNLKFCSKPGRMILSRMSLILKLSPILLNIDLNGEMKVLKNVYIASLYMAFRLHGLIRLYFKKIINQKFVLSCVKQGVLKIARYSYRHVKTNDAIPGFQVQHADLQWISLRAFEARINSAAGRYKEVAKDVKCWRKNMERKFFPSRKDRLLQLKTVTSVPLPGVFSTMR